MYNKDGKSGGKGRQGENKGSRGGYSSNRSGNSSYRSGSSSGRGGNSSNRGGSSAGRGDSRGGNRSGSRSYGRGGSGAARPGGYESRPERNPRRDENKSAGRFSFSAPDETPRRNKPRDDNEYRGERKPAGQGGRRQDRNSASGRNDRRFDDRRKPAGSREYREPQRQAPRHLDSNSPRQLDTRFEEKTDKIDSGATVGRNAVLELLKSGRDIDKLFVLKPSEDEKPTGSVVKIVAMAVERHIPVVEVDRRKLDELAGDTPHQGVAAVAPEKDYAELDDIFELAARRGEKPLIVIADEINDPHNLGAIIRSAEAAGAHGIVIPKRRSAPITPTVAKASAGAVSWLPIVKVTNLSMLIEELRDRGVWVFCAETGGADYRSLDYDTPAALIVGSEGEGVSRLLREKSDFIVSIPMKGQVNSLNVSCAAAVMLFKMTESRSPVQPESPEDDEDELFDGEFDFDDEFGDDETDVFSSENSPENEFEGTDAEPADFAAIVADGDEAPEDLEDLFTLDGIDIDFDL